MQYNKSIHVVKTVFITLYYTGVVLCDLGFHSLVEVGCTWIKIRAGVRAPIVNQISLLSGWDVKVLSRSTYNFAWRYLLCILNIQSTASKPPARLHWIRSLVRPRAIIPMSQLSLWDLGNSARYIIQIHDEINAKTYLPIARSDIFLVIAIGCVRTYYCVEIWTKWTLLRE